MSGFHDTLLKVLLPLSNIVWVWLSGLMFLDMTNYTDFFLIIESALSVMTNIFNNLATISLQYSTNSNNETVESKEFLNLLWTDLVTQMTSLVAQILNFGQWFLTTAFANMGASDLAAIEQLLYQMNRLCIDSQLQILYTYFMDSSELLGNSKLKYLVDGVRTDCQSIYTQSLTAFFVVRDDRVNLLSTVPVTAQLQISLQKFYPLFQSLCDKLNSLLTLLQQVITESAALPPLPVVNSTMPSITTLPNHPHLPPPPSSAPHIPLPPPPPNNPLFNSMTPSTQIQQPRLPSVPLHPQQRPSRPPPPPPSPPTPTLPTPRVLPPHPTYHTNYRSYVTSTIPPPSLPSRPNRSFVSSPASTYSRNAHSTNTPIAPISRTITMTAPSPPPPPPPRPAPVPLPQPTFNNNNKPIKYLRIQDMKTFRFYSATFELQSWEDLNQYASIDTIEVDDLSQLIQNRNDGNTVISLCMPSADGSQILSIGNVILQQY